jgi:hypothetical protein
MSQKHIAAKQVLALFSRNYLTAIDLSLADYAKYNAHNRETRDDHLPQARPLST